MTAKVLCFQTRGALIRESRRKDPEPTFSMIVAAEHERIAENAERLGAAMDRLPEIDLPCDVEARAATREDP